MSLDVRPLPQRIEGTIKSSDAIRDLHRAQRELPARPPVEYRDERLRNGAFLTASRT